MRELVHAADPEVEETIKRRVQPYFVLQGNVCALLAAKDHVNVFLYDGAIVPDPEGIITGGHDNQTARTVAIYEDEPRHRARAAADVRADHRQQPRRRLAQAQAGGPGGARDELCEAGDPAAHVDEAVLAQRVREVVAAEDAHAGQGPTSASVAPARQRAAGDAREQRHAAAGREHAGDLGDRAQRLLDQVQRGEAADRVEAPVAEREVRRARRAPRRSVARPLPRGLREHRARGVEPDHDPVAAAPANARVKLPGPQATSSTASPGAIRSISSAIRRSPAMSGPSAPISSRPPSGRQSRS